MRRVGVFCGSSSGADPVYAAAAAAMGQALAQGGIDLVYGGGAVGLMGVVADSVMAAGGRVIGVIPSGLFSREVAHVAISELHHTATMHERKALMYELSDAFVAMPGGLGTLDELFETLTWAQLGLHDKPVGLLDVAGYFDGLVHFIESTVQQGFTKQRHVQRLLSDPSPEALLSRLALVPLLDSAQHADPTQI
ncbi:MAG: TIGR00730 family Rossman fold protein [Acidimicrobiales bacterium]